jgi:hypothetical protein
VCVCVCVCGSSVQLYFKGNKVVVTYLDNTVRHGLIKQSHYMHGHLYDLTLHSELGFGFFSSQTLSTVRGTFDIVMGFQGNNT